MVGTRVTESDKVDLSTVLAPRTRGAEYVVVWSNLVGNGVVQVDRRIRDLLRRDTLGNLAGNIAISSRRQERASTLAEHVGEDAAALNVLAREDVHVRKLLEHSVDVVVAGKLKSIETGLSKVALSLLLEVRVRVDETSDGRDGVSSHRGVVGVVNQRSDIGDRTTKGPTRNVKLRSVRALQSSSPANSLAASRVTITSNLCVLGKTSLVETERGTDRVKGLVTLRATGRKVIQGTLRIGNSHNITGRKVGCQKRLVNRVDHVLLGVRGKNIARSGERSVRVLRKRGNNEFVLASLAGDKDRSNGVLSVVGSILASTVQNLVGLLDVEVTHANIHLARIEDITGLGALPVAGRRVERVLVGGGDGRHRSDGGEPKGAEARNRDHPDHERLPVAEKGARCL